MAEIDSVAGIRAARKWAEWHLGDASHANDILYAYEHPEYVSQLEEEWT